MAFNRRMALGLGLGGSAAAVAIGYFSASHSGGGSAPVIEKGTLHRGNGAEPGTLDPALTQTETEDNINADLMTGLIVNGPDAQPLPGMAQSWTTSPDGKIWTFHLREALWSDGVPVTADDFVFAWRRLVDPVTAAPYAYMLYSVRNAEAINAGKMPLSVLGVRAIDPMTFEVSLAHPAPYLLEMVTHMTLYPQPRHLIAARGKDWIKPGIHVGNGAYMLKEWIVNDHITLVKNPRFFDAHNVAIEKVVFYPTDDYAAALKRMRAGELDTQTRLPPEEIGWIRANMRETIAPIPQLTLEMIAVNHGRKPFDDPRVRQALSLALNREVITDKIRRVGDTPAYSIIPPGIANFPGGNNLGFKRLPYGARVAQARALMQQAGFGPDNLVRTSFMIRSTSAGIYRAVAAAIQQMFSAIFIDITIIGNDFAVTMAATQAHDFDMAELGWSADFNDAETFLNLFRTGGGDNWGQYSDPAFDRLLNASQNEVDLAGRGRLLAQAEALLLRDQAVIPLFFWANPSMVWPYVKNWVPNHTDQNRSRWLSIDEKARTAQFAK